MRRWKIIGIYVSLGPLTASLIAAAFVVLYERMHISMLLPVVAMYLVFSFPFSLLAAIGSAISHIHLSSKVSTSALIIAVCITGPAIQGAVFLLLGRALKGSASPIDIIGFITPPAVSAACVAIFIKWQTKAS